MFILRNMYINVSKDLLKAYDWSIEWSGIVAWMLGITDENRVLAFET